MGTLHLLGDSSKTEEKLGFGVEVEPLLRQGLKGVFVVGESSYKGQHHRGESMEVGVPARLEEFDFPLQ